MAQWLAHGAATGKLELRSEVNLRISLISMGSWEHCEGNAYSMEKEGTVYASLMNPNNIWSCLTKEYQSFHLPGNPNSLTMWEQKSPFDLRCVMAKDIARASMFISPVLYPLLWPEVLING